MAAPYIATPFVTDQQVMLSLAAVLKFPDVTAMLQASPNWYVIVSQISHPRAANDVYDVLLSRGYIPSIITSWDRGPEFELILSVGNAINDGEALDKVAASYLDTWRQYRGELLPSIVLTINGVPQFPTGIAGTLQAGQITTAAGSTARLPPGDRHCDGWWGPWGPWN